MITKDAKVLTVKHDHCHYIFELLLYSIFCCHFFVFGALPGSGAGAKSPSSANSASSRL